MRNGKMARVLDLIAAAHDAEAAKLTGKKAAFQRDLAVQARARADQIDVCARCRRRFDAPGIGRGFGAALQVGGVAVHYPACATPEEIAEVGRRIEALRRARGATR